VVVAASDPDAAGAGVFFGGGLGGGRVGFPEGGVDDGVEADRGYGVDDGGDAFVDEGGGVFG
jgi:hypothetical protein